MVDTRTATSDSPGVAEIMAALTESSAASPYSEQQNPNVKRVLHDLEKFQSIPLGVFNGRPISVEPRIAPSLLPNGSRFFAFQLQPPPRPTQMARAVPNTVTSEVRDSADRSRSPTPEYHSVQTHLLIGRVFAPSSHWHGMAATGYLVSKDCLHDKGFWIISDELLRPSRERSRPDRRSGRGGFDGTNSSQARFSCAQLQSDIPNTSVMYLEVRKEGYKCGLVGDENLEPELDEDRYHELLQQCLELRRQGHSMLDAETFVPGRNTFANEAEADKYHNRNRYGPKWRLMPGELWTLLSSLDASAETQLLSKIKDGICARDEATPTFTSGSQEVFSFRWNRYAGQFNLPELHLERDGIVQAQDDGFGVTSVICDKNGRNPTILLPLGQLVTVDSSLDETTLPVIFVRDLSREKWGLLAAFDEYAAEDGDAPPEVVDSWISSSRTVHPKGLPTPFSYATLEGLDASQHHTCQDVKLNVSFCGGYNLGVVIREQGALSGRWKAG